MKLLAISFGLVSFSTTSFAASEAEKYPIQLTCPAKSDPQNSAKNLVIGIDPVGEKVAVKNLNPEAYSSIVVGANSGISSALDASNFSMETSRSGIYNLGSTTVSANSSQTLRATVHQAASLTYESQMKVYGQEKQTVVLKNLKAFHKITWHIDWSAAESAPWQDYSEYVGQECVLN